MASRPELQDPEPISPELVLVSPPDVARRAREELREPPLLRNTPSAVRERLPEPPPLAAVAPPPVRPKRRRGRIALVCVAIAAAIAGVAYAVVGRDNPRHVNPAAASAPGGSAPTSTLGAAPTRPTPTTVTRRAHVKRTQATTTSRPAKRAAQTGKPAVKPKHTTKVAAKPKQAGKPAAKPKQAGKPKRTTERPAGAPSTGFVPARTWTWPESKGARAYETRFLLDGRVVLDMRTTQPRLVLPRTFTFRAGAYRWVVRRIPPGASPRPIVDSKFVLSRAAAARANP
jgi:hypothetical protein